MLYLRSPEKIWNNYKPRTLNRSTDRMSNGIDCFVRINASDLLHLSNTDRLILCIIHAYAVIDANIEYIESAWKDITLSKYTFDVQISKPLML